MWGGSPILGGRVDKDMFSLGLSQGKVISPQLDLNRVSQRRGADQGQTGAGQKAHLAESDKRGTGIRELTDKGRRSDCQFGKLHRRRSEAFNADPTAPPGCTWRQRD